jgi:hypothetical protein
LLQEQAETGDEQQRIDGYSEVTIGKAGEQSQAEYRAQEGRRNEFQIDE